MAGEIEERQDQFDEVARRLDQQYGPRVLDAKGDIVSELVGTILSQSTNDRNSSAAFASLRDAFPTWEDVVNAETDDVAAAIRRGGLSKQKAPRIQHALKAMTALEESGRRIQDLDVDTAMALLMDMEGVGPKTAACVLLFAVGMPIFPVDTHVARVMTRLGVLPPRTGTAAQQRLLTQYSGPHPPTIYAAHVETIEHGRRVCHPRRPRCEVCVLQDICDYYRDVVAPGQ